MAFIVHCFYQRSSLSKKLTILITCTLWPLVVGYVHKTPSCFYVFFSFWLFWWSTVGIAEGKQRQGVFKKSVSISIYCLFSVLIN